MIGIDELRLLCDCNVARGSDETAEFPQAEAQGLVFAVQGLRPSPGFLDHDADGIASRRRDALVHRDLLSHELGQFRAVRVRVRHRGLDEDLVPAPGDTGAQRRQDVRKVLDVARADEDEVARDALDLDARPRALRIPTRDREPLLLHRGQDEPLKVAEQRQLVDEQDALMRFVDCARDDPIVRLRAELWMAAVWIVADVSEEFGLARSGRQDERPSRDRDEDLSRALLLDLATLLERLLVEHADHVARPLVDDDLFLPKLLPGRRDAIPALELCERDFEDAAEQVAERIAHVRLGRCLRSPALRAHAIGRRRVRAAVDALVAEPFRDVDGRLLGIDEVAFRAREPVLFLQDLVALLHFDEGPFRILRIADDSNLFRHRREVKGEGLGDHRLARPRRADEQEVPPLVRGDSRERDRLVLANDPLHRIVRDRDLRSRLEVVEGEPLVRSEHLRSRDRLHPVYGARSLRVQTSMPAGCFVIVPIFVPTTECMFISDAMSRIRWVIIPSKTTARVCLALLSVSTSSRTGTSVTTPSPSSRSRAVDDPPS